MSDGHSVASGIAYHSTNLTVVLSHEITHLLISIKRHPPPALMTVDMPFSA